MADNEHLRNDEDVEAILRLAVQGTETSGEKLRERLRITAAELGISDEELAAAEERYRREIEGERMAVLVEQEDKSLWKEFRRTQVHDFLGHFWIYAAVNLGLFGMDWFSGNGINWAYWPMLGWGIAVVIHLASILAGFSDENQKEFEKWKRKKIRRQAKDASAQGPKRKSVDKEVQGLLREGRKIDAIKMVREESGMGVAEAKAYVEEVESRL